MLYKNQSIKKYLDDLAAKKPAPGGGSVAALSGALGCALLSMVANFTLGKEKYKKYEKEIKRILSKTESFRARFLELVDLDVIVYSKYAGTSDKRIKAAAKKESQKIVKEISILCYKALQFCPALAEKGNTYLINDVLAGAELLSAGFNSALVNIDTPR
ncbi:MAG: cyclodeaminase/cyclohydrolase family protein [Candidatus Omnitrophota bacterium]|nr:cyclodeaminase/cyclohydrolase family protein [Candidatus Omnitrophota bacterium]